MAKKPKTPTQLKRRYSSLSKVCLGGQFASLIAPFVTIGLVNFEDYFVQYEGWKVSLAAILAAFIMGITVFTIVNKKIQNSYGSLIIKLAIFTACLFLIDKIIYDLKYIMLFTIVGLFGALALEKEGQHLQKKADRIQKGIEAAEDEITKQAYLDEQIDKNDRRSIKIKDKSERKVEW